MTEQGEGAVRGWHGLRQLREQLDRDHDLLGPSESGFDSLLREQEAQILSILAAEGGSSTVSAPVMELRSARHFREGLVKIGVEQAVNSSAERAHPESGPLNPEKLVVHSLAAMRELSPRYLSRFVAYVDTLFWLEQVRDSKE